ncbi:MAG: acetate--CoA ligase family protein, partial [Thermoplasmatota archaeon]
MNATPNPELRNPSLAAIFRPRSIAVVGASRDLSSIGRHVFENLLRGGFEGPVFPVNPNASHVGGVRAYASVSEIPDAVDLAVIVVPAARVLAVVDDCGKKGVQGLVILSAGFREIGGEGEAREAALADALRRYGMRAIGPNCMGVLNTDPTVRMNATFSPARVAIGTTAFVSQSGALGMAILDEAAELDLGLSYFVSLGNKTNVSTNDLLVEWEHDERVKLILLYLENFGNPRKFIELARRIAPTKPILAVKSGRTSAGARAARSHTGALAERDVFAEALFESAGVLRANTMRELFDYARVFAHAPPPNGRKVAVVTNSGGPGIMATDALGEHGLELAALSDATKAQLRASLLPEASVENPVDVIAGGGAPHVRIALDAVLADPGVDAALVIYTPPVFVDEEAVARAILAADRQGKPLLACVPGKESGGLAYHALTAGGIPTFVFPEGAVRALGALARYEERRRRPTGVVPRLANVDEDAARALVVKAL